MNTLGEALMDRVQLQHFVLLTQMLNYSAVAKQEFISQPALTKQIRRLEEELGVQLFLRSKHGVSLTYAGAEFYKHAVILLDETEKAIHHMDSIRKGKTGTLELSAVYGLDEVVSNCAASFLKTCPEISVNITSGTAAQQIQAINRQSADLFFSFAQLLELYPGIETLPLPDDHFGVCLREEDAEKVRTEGFSYLDGLPHLLEYRSEGGPLFTGLMLSIREAIGLRSENITYYSSNSTIFHAIQAGMGFAFLPTQMNFGLCPPGVVRLPLDLPEACIKRAVGWHRNNANTSVARFIELLSDSLPK